MKNRIIAIGGGVGPSAGQKLEAIITENTVSGGTDQGHLEVHHFSRPGDITDRTRFLLGELDENPAEGMFRSLKAARAAAEALDHELVFGVPCNTFHAPRIFDRFREMARELEGVELLHMLDECADLITELLPEAERIGLMSTTGTRSVRVYNEILEPKGLELIEVPEEMQAELHDSIYNLEWGIKAVSNPVTERARNNFLKYVDKLREAGAEAVILGCTEIPLALPEADLTGTPLIDPMFALARAMIKKVNKENLRKIVPAV